MADGVATRWNNRPYQAAEDRLVDTLIGMAATATTARPGKRPGPGLEVTVLTGPDRAQVAPGVGFLNDAVGGTYRIGFAANVTKTISTRPASGTSRIDLVIARVYDVDVDAADGIREANIEVIAGTAAASPNPPAAPDGSLVLAQLTVPNSGTIAVTTNIARTVAPGGVLPVATQAERDAIANPYNGLQVFREDTGNVEGRIAGTWRVLHRGTRPAAKASRSTAQNAIVTSTWTKINFNTEIRDSGSIFTPTGSPAVSSDFVIPETGVYQIFARVAWDLGTSSGALQTAITINATRLVLDRRAIQSVNTPQQVSVATELDLTAGDVIGLSVFQASGSNQSTYVTDTTYGTDFSLRLVG